jgi:hypothetical protein
VSKSIEDETEAPIRPKFTRIDVLYDAFIFERAEQGLSTRITHISHIDYKHEFFQGAEIDGFILASGYQLLLLTELVRSEDSRSTPNINSFLASIAAADEVSVDDLIQKDAGAIEEKELPTVGTPQFSSSSSAKQWRESAQAAIENIRVLATEDNSWEKIAEQDSVTFLKKEGDSPSAFFVQGVGEIDATPLEILGCTMDSVRKSQWDRMCSGGREVERVDATTRVQYESFVGVWVSFVNAVIPCR